MARKRMVGPGGGDFALDISTAGGRLGGGRIKSRKRTRNRSIKKIIKKSKKQARKNLRTEQKEDMLERRVQSKFEGTRGEAYPLRYKKNRVSKERRKELTEKARKNPNRFSRFKTFKKKRDSLSTKLEDKIDSGFSIKKDPLVQAQVEVRKFENATDLRRSAFKASQTGKGGLGQKVDKEKAKKLLIKAKFEEVKANAKAVDVKRAAKQKITARKNRAKRERKRTRLKEGAKRSRN
jgi:hypothetical protein